LSQPSQTAVANRALVGAQDCLGVSEAPPNDVAMQVPALIRISRVLPVDEGEEAPRVDSGLVGRGVYCERHW